MIYQMVGKFTIHKTYGDIKEAYTTIYIYTVLFMNIGDIPNYKLWRDQPVDLRLFVD